MQQDKVAFSIRTNILEKFPEGLRKNVCVAGGAVRDKLLGVELKDYDIFLDSKVTEDALMAFLEKNGKKGNVNAQTANYTFEGKWIQLVRGKYFDMNTSAVIDSFDFVHCCAMVTMDAFRVHPEFYRSIATKHILVNKLTFPLSSLERMQKYIQKGYVACNGTLHALSTAINAMPPATFTLDPNMSEADKAAQSLLFYSDGSPRFVGVD